MKKYIYKTFSLVLAAVFLSSCLKDDRMVLNPDKSHNVVEFANPGERAAVGSIYTLYPLLVDLQPEVEFPITFSYSGPEASAPEDIVIKFEVADDQIVTDYNEDQDTEYSMMPSDLYSFSSMDATIKKGESKATVIATFKSDNFDFSTPYALPLTIVSASYGIISGNYGTIILNVGPKNQYHGDYTYTYNTSLGTNTTGKTVSLQTVGPNTVKLLPGLIATYSNYVDYTIDPATNKVTVSMTSLLPIATDPSSHWDPETKTLHVNWTSNGGGRTFQEKFVKIE